MKIHINVTRMVIFTVEKFKISSFQKSARWNCWWVVSFFFFFFIFCVQISAKKYVKIFHILIFSFPNARLNIPDWNSFLLFVFLFSSLPFLFFWFRDLLSKGPCDYSRTPPVGHEFFDMLFPESFYWGILSWVNNLVLGKRLGLTVEIKIKRTWKNVWFKPTFDRLDYFSSTSAKDFSCSALSMIWCVKAPAECNNLEPTNLKEIQLRKVDVFVAVFIVPPPVREHCVFQCVLRLFVPPFGHQHCQEWDLQCFGVHRSYTRF